jgi:hypothetical protein
VSDRQAPASADIDGEWLDNGDDDGDNGGGEGGQPADTPAATDGAEAADAGDAEAEQPEQHTLWPERPENLNANDEDAVAEWKERVGLPDRDAYELPELAEGQEYTELGESLGERVTQLAYDLDMSPEQAQQLVLRGDGILKALAESRDTEDKRSGSKAIVEEFGGNRDAAKAHVAGARATLRGLPDGLGELLLEGRGPDGRKLAYRPEFLRWAAELGAKSGQPASQPRDSKMELRAELAELESLRDRDIDAYRRKWRNTGITASDRALQIMRALEGTGPKSPSAAETHAELRDLERLRSSDPEVYEFGSWRGGRSAAERHAEILRKRT